MGLLSAIIRAMNTFLPINQETLSERGWDAVDFALVTGDAYVDHPSFGAAVIARVLEADGFRVGIIAQPDWKSPESLKVLGRPRLGFLITSGNLDSMVNHFTAAKKKRRSDSYTPGGAAGRRPDRAVTVYANLARQAYKKMPVIIGGLEASLRRMAHYDYWKDALRRSVLLDSKADLLVYGMGETSVRRIAAALERGRPVSGITEIRGTVYSCATEDIPEGTTILPNHEALKTDPKAFAESFRIQYENADPFTGGALAEPYGSRAVVQNPPAPPISREDMDEVYALPYTRAAHPSYTEKIPAMEEIQFSLVSSRGCFGACSFCALAFHQGRIISSRSPESLVDEAKILVGEKDFKGYIHDVGGPTANFRAPACDKQGTKGSCPGKRCLAPTPCPSLKADHSEYMELLRELRELEGVKKVFIRSGIRFDYMLADTKNDFLTELCEHHVSGQLKVAPEHVSPDVLAVMGKPGRKTYDKFTAAYREVNRKLEKKQYLVPYFISGHPGSRLKDAIILAEYLRDTRFIPDQAQDFYPTPGTLATAMWYSGIDPMSGKKVHVPKDATEKAMQRALLQYNRPENREIVRKALLQAGRGDLIGNGPKCLIPGDSRGSSGSNSGQGRAKPSGQSGRSKGKGGNAGTSGKSGRSHRSAAGDSRGKGRRR